MTKLLRYNNSYLMLHIIIIPQLIIHIRFIFLNFNVGRKEIETNLKQLCGSGFREWNVNVNHFMT